MASLLLHLAVLMAVSGSFRRMPDDRGQSRPLRVDYLEYRAKQGHVPQDRPPRPAALTRAESVSRPLPAQTSRPVTPPGGVSSSKPVGGTAPSPVLGIAPLAPADKVSPDRGGGLDDVGTGKGSGSAKSGADGFGANSLRRGGDAPGVAQGVGHQRTAYQELLKRLVEAHKEYPLAARRSRQEGSCLRRFVLSRSGALTRIEELSSCGHAYLDEAATRAIRAVGAFPPLPDEIPGAEVSFTVPITFTLTR
jgi:periplasmic protein TonB